MEARLITFRRLKEVCTYRDCYFLERDDYVLTCAKLGYGVDIKHRCTAKNCPVWAKLRRGDELTRKGSISKKSNR